MAMGTIIKVEIDTKTYIRFLLAVSAFVLTIFLLWKLLPVLLILAISFFLAIAFNKPVLALAKRLPGRSRVLATALVYVVFVTLLGLFFVTVVPPAIHQTNVFIESLPQFIGQLSQKDSVAATLIKQYRLQVEVDSFVRGLQAQVGSFAQGIGSNVVTGVSTLLTSVVTGIAVLVITFLLLIEGPKWQDLLWQTYSDRALLKRHQQLATRMYHVVTGYVNGQVLVASIAAMLAALVLLVLTTFFPLPFAVVLPLTVIVFIFELIPLVGPTVGAIVVLTVLSFNSFGAALIYLIFFLIYMQIEGNIVQPAVQSRTVEISALTVFVSVITGVVLLGIPGGILAIPVAGCLRVLLLDYIEHQRLERSK